MLQCPPALPLPCSRTLFIQQKLQAVKYCHAQRSWLGRKIRLGIGFAIGIGTWQHCMTCKEGGCTVWGEGGSCQRGAQGEGKIIRSFVGSINTILMSAAWRFCWRSLRAPQLESCPPPSLLSCPVSCCRQSPAACRLIYDLICSSFIAIPSVLSPSHSLSHSSDVTRLASGSLINCGPQLKMHTHLTHTRTHTL